MRRMLIFTRTAWCVKPHRNPSLNRTSTRSQLNQQKLWPRDCTTSANDDALIEALPVRPITVRTHRNTGSECIHTTKWRGHKWLDFKHSGWVVAFKCPHWGSAYTGAVVRTLDELITLQTKIF